MREKYSLCPLIVACTVLGVWWCCACLRRFTYKKAPLRAVPRHIDPATRKSNPKPFPQYMRRAVEATQQPAKTLRYCYRSKQLVCNKFKLFAPRAAEVVGPFGVHLLSAVPCKLVAVYSPLFSAAKYQWFHICKPCFPGIGWRRLLSSARHQGLGDCRTACSGRLTPILKQRLWHCTCT